MIDASVGWRAVAGLGGTVVLGLWMFLRSLGPTPEPQPAIEHETKAASMHPVAVTKPGARPLLPPVRGRDRPQKADEPMMLANADEIRSQAYVQAVDDGQPQPGETAFRASVGAFVEHNRALAAAQAEREGLSMSEVEELTVFGLLVQTSQRWSEVEELVGHEVTAEQRQASDTLMNDLNHDFVENMRTAVANGATEEQRWELIRAIESDYRTSYYEITGMNAELLDSLLAGDITRAHAPIATRVEDLDFDRRDPEAGVVDPIEAPSRSAEQP